jgi:hypothetical protein
MSHAVPVSRLSPVGLAILAAMFLLAAILHAQDKPTVPITPAAAPAVKELKPTELQSLRLQVKQKDALLAKQRYEALQSILQQAQKDYTDGLKALTDEAEKTKVENGWPKDTQFEPNTLAFTPAPPPAPKEKKP